MPLENMPLTHKAYISLGSNLDDRENYLRQAISMMQQDTAIMLMVFSSIYETIPIGYTDQPLFLNMVIGVQTSYSSIKLLHVLQKIESNLGRKRDIHWGPRTIDLDLLFFDIEELDTAELQLPHPRMLKRAFVLVPLLDVFQMDNHPLTKMITEQLDNLEDKDGVRLWKETI